VGEGGESGGGGPGGGESVVGSLGVEIRCGWSDVCRPFELAAVLTIMRSIRISPHASGPRAGVRWVCGALRALRPSGLPFVACR